ncbi:MAG: hydroxyacid dehydrogenase [Pseudomonadota bacterium]
MKILVCDTLPEKGLTALRAIAGATVDRFEGLAKPKLLKAVANYDALVVRSATKVDRKVIEAGKKLQVVARAGMGYDNIDVDAATKKGIVVMNTPSSNAVSVAELTIGMMISVARHIPQANCALKRGIWDKKKCTGVELGYKVLGLIGLGTVGRMVAQCARGLKMDVIANDPYVPVSVARDLGVSMVSLPDLWKRSDYISLHATLNKETRKIINAKTIARMKDGVRIVNVARGALLDEKALAAALKSGKVAAAAVDVFEKEPPPKNHPFLRLENVVVTPHLGASTHEAQQRVALVVAEQLRAYFIDHTLINAVNVPT